MGHFESDKHFATVFWEPFFLVTFDMFIPILPQPLLPLSFVLYPYPLQFIELYTVDMRITKACDLTLVLDNPVV